MITLTGGYLKGLQLKSPSGRQTRPSGERLRQGIFNVLQFFQFRGQPLFSEAIVADIFAGSGAFGFDAAGHGAKAIHFIENHKNALDCLRANGIKVRQSLEKQNIKVGFGVQTDDVTHAYGRLPECRVIFLDPPYHEGWLLKCLDLEARFHRLESGGVLLFEAHEKEHLEGVDVQNLLKAARLHLFNEKLYGEGKVFFFQKQET